MSREEFVLKFIGSMTMSDNGPKPNGSAIDFDLFSNRCSV